MSEKIKQHYMIHTTVNDETGESAHVLFLAGREGRGDMLRNFSFETIGKPGTEGYGFILSAEGEDGKAEVIGSVDEPLPMELLELLASEDGLTIGYMDVKTSDVTHGQLVNLDIESEAFNNYVKNKSSPKL